MARTKKISTKKIKSKKPKLVEYAERLEAAKEKARKEIRLLKLGGFSVEPSIVAFANSPTNERITKNTLEKGLVALNINRIRSTRTIDINTVNNIKPGNAPLQTGPIDTGVKVTGLKKRINQILKDTKPSDRLAMDLARLVYQTTGKAPAPGMKTGVFEIDDDYDPSKSYELSKHITFKYMDSDIARTILQNPFTNEAANEALQEDIHHRSYLSNVASVPALKGLSPETLANLESIMNSSAAWHIAKRNAHDSEQTKENWTKLYNKLDDDYEDDDLDELATMIENEESLTSIISRADEMLTSYMKGN